MKAPIAKKILKKTELFDDALLDEYDWLRDRNWPNVQDKEVLGYLNQENDYTDNIMSPHKDFTDQIFNELKDRIVEDDETVPVKKGNYYYHSYIKKGMDYWVHVRRYQTLEAEAEIILDENELAEGKDFFNLGSMAISPNEKLLAYATDCSGDERFEIKIINLETKEIIDVISNTMGQMVWYNDNKIFYIPASKNWRAEKIYAHNLGDKKSEDILLYEEKNPIFRVWVNKSSSKDYIFLGSSSSETSEVYYIDLTSTTIEPKLILPRQGTRKYSISHKGKYFYILINDEGKNFRLTKTLIEGLQTGSLLEIIKHSDNVYLTDMCQYKNFYTIETKENGLAQITIYNNDDKLINQINLPQNKSYNADVIYTDFEDTKLRFSYTSLDSPYTIKEFSINSGDIKNLKTKYVPNYNHEEYNSERIFATSKDGKKIPISIFYKKELLKKDGTNPLYLYGYGSYGISVPTSFRTSILSLIDRGFIYAIAHIRGGDDLGFDWYESAKFLNKKHTFDDFIASAEFLIKENYASDKNIVIAGGSAGGMLVGTCMNMRPDLFKAIIAHVPFVDVLNTMLDDSLPLTPGEFKEWGNPKEEEYYHYIKSYSPYDNIQKINYPHIYVTAGLTDPRVTYWEPAKWVAKLRDYKTDNNILLLKTNMEAGHQGKTGRFNYLKDYAQEYSFLFNICFVNS